MPWGTTAPERRGLTTLPDGCVLGWSEWGDPQGRRGVLVVPGIGGAVLWTHAEPILTTLLARSRRSGSTGPADDEGPTAP
ncbi:hypothetical protein DFP74_6288 [Nocardiopsis sp. Huas11]|uniref:hypothetical protein n=1 Tax=Nocardiopsis sp. Huas11 TaxID=2183912 RepID=UPI000EB5AE7F|nr:hypothetical protein [Nocardiopsis sp. Huas11]RKS10516.1 hypothetical protein DFP74_6288 [Nocardiopsis sp. Huas11]